MPELPEVETVKRHLEPKIIHKRIIHIDFRYSKIIKEITEKEFEKRLLNKEFTGVNRYGKYLIFRLGELNLIVHLRMEGKFFYVDQDPEIDKHTHIIFTLEDKSRKKSFLIYNDVRKFGTMHLVENKDLEEFIPLKKLGFEPLDEDMNFLYLKEKFKSKKKTVKESLLDQTIITGLGNIYVDEILFASKINPLKKAQDLTDKDLENLVDNTRKIIEKAIENKGTTIRTFSVAKNVSGHNQNNLKVYGRKGQKCFTCNTNLKKIKVGGRGTTYCPKCQKEI